MNTFIWLELLLVCEDLLITAGDGVSMNIYVKGIHVGISVSLKC